MHTRKSHQKSRNGCRTCKLRRIKCDENHPCSECVRRGTQCQFSQSRERVQASASLVELRKAGPRIAKERLRPGQHLISPTVFQPGAGLQLDHLALLHHYTTSTAGTLALRGVTRSVWELAIPREAYGHDFLMHCLLAVSAQHLSFLDGDIERSSHYQTVSAHHQNRALTGYWRVLSKANNPENCLALYAASTIVVVFACMPDVQANKSAIDRAIGFFRTCTGVYILLQQWRERLLATALAPLMHFSTEDVDKESDEIDRLKDTLHSLENTIQNHSHMPLSERLTYLCALTSLKMCIDLSRTSHSYFECLFIWPITMPREFPVLVSCRAPVALALVAIYAALLHKARDVWFIGDWGRRIIEEIKTLDPEGMAKFVGWLVLSCS